MNCRSFVERWWHAALQWRRPTYVEVAPAQPFVIKSSHPSLGDLHAIDLRSMETLRAPFWLRLTDLVTLQMCFLDASGVRHVRRFFGPVAVVDQLREAVHLACRHALEAEREFFSDSMAEFERARKALFLPSCYVRFSSVARLVQAHDGLCSDARRKRFEVWKGHPFLTQGPDDESILERFSSLLLFIQAPHDVRAAHNEAYVKMAAKQEEAYFSTVEATPLTEEQVESSLYFDDANVTVAGAGSGKTSVMVSKVGFALKSELYNDREILVLAYNKAAAKELRTRIQDSVGKALGRRIDVEARTFHSLGLKLWLRNRDKAEGKTSRPLVVDFTKSKGKRLLRSLLVQLAQDPANRAFAEKFLGWAGAYRYAVPEFEAFDAEALDQREARYHQMCKLMARNSKRDAKPYEPTIPTFDKHKYVRSSEEARIFNWLYLRDINFVYERAAPDWIRDRINEGLPEVEKVRDYRPDFTYTNPADPTRRVLHEHFGLDNKGRAPAFLGKRYEARAEHKRSVLNRILKDKGRPTPRFIETCSGYFSDGSIFTRLEAALRQSGIAVPPVNAERRDRALREVLDEESIMDLVAAFVSSIRDSGLTLSDVKFRAQSLGGPNRERAASFLSWMGPFLDAVESSMKMGFDAEVGNVQEGEVRKACRPVTDYAGMVSGAVSALGDSEVPMTPYKFVLVDEFQDISRLRAQLVEGLLAQWSESSILFCVGDDWQSINRFAGSDVDIFRRTHAGLTSSQPGSGASPLRPRWSASSMLKKTFRCPQGVADIARWFVMRGAKGTLIDKPVEAHNGATLGVVRVIEHGDSAVERLSVLRHELERIATLNCEAIQAGKTIEVFVLTRNKQKKYLPEGIDGDVLDRLSGQFVARGLKVEHHSLHGSKGLGADYVVIAGLDAGRGGYPRDSVKDPLLELLLPRQRNDLDEERRLFYVGLTRAKREVTLLCVGARPSIFVHELADYPEQSVLHWDRIDGVVRHLCPLCRRGWLRRRPRKPSEVQCSRRPYCGFCAEEVRFPGLGIVQ